MEQTQGHRTSKKLTQIRTLINTTAAGEESKKILVYMKPMTTTLIVQCDKGTNVRYVVCVCLCNEEGGREGGREKRQADRLRDKSVCVCV